MKHIYLSLLLIVLLICSCTSGYKNRSIYAGISEDELRDLVNTDEGSLIAEAYFNSIRALNANPEPTGQQSRYKEVTYGRLVDNIKIYDNAKSQAEKEWENRWGNMASRIDSVYGFWLGRIAQEGLDSYVKIELEEISKTNGEPGFWGGGPSLDKFEPTIKITPLRGKLDGCAIQFFFLGPKDEMGQYPHVWRSEWSGHAPNYHELGAFSSPIKFKEKAFVDVEVSTILANRKFSELTYAECLDGINFVYTIHSITLDGKINREFNLLERVIPKEVLNLKQQNGANSGKNSDNFEVNYAREQLAIALIDPEYEDKLHYTSNKAKEAAYQADPTAYGINHN